MKKLFAADKILVTVFLILLAVGLLFFLSASLGVLAADTAKFVSIVRAQILLGLCGGALVFFVFLRVKSEFWQKYAAVFFFLALGITLLVYIPGVGFSHGGARRWIDLGPLSLQPAEFLKAAALIYLSALYAKFLKKKKDISRHDKPVNLFQLLAPALIILFLCAAALLPQPDTKSVVLIFLVAASILFVVGLPYRIIFTILGILVLVGTFLVFTKPYVRERFQTFLNPEHDPRGASYQLQQALIGMGSGGVFGQGFGQSVQKFSFLPEPHGDSIFAVVGEEVGFIGTVVIIGLYLVFVLRGFKLSQIMDSPFARLLFIGFFSLFAFQAFLNIGSISGAIPLTGVPLPLMSHGGTSLLINLALFGIIVRMLYEQHKIAS